MHILIIRGSKLFKNFAVIKRVIKEKKQNKTRVFEHDIFYYYLLNGLAVTVGLRSFRTHRRHSRFRVGRSQQGP